MVDPSSYRFSLQLLSHVIVDTISWNENNLALLFVFKSVVHNHKSARRLSRVKRGLSNRAAAANLLVRVRRRVR